MRWRESISIPKTILLHWRDTKSVSQNKCSFHHSCRGVWLDFNPLVKHVYKCSYGWRHFSLSLWLRMVYMDWEDSRSASFPAGEATWASLTVPVAWDAHHASLPNVEASVGQATLSHQNLVLILWVGPIYLSQKRTKNQKPKTNKQTNNTTTKSIV